MIVVNLAAAIKCVYPKKEVGLLDTDVFGPSIPLMMNLNETPLLTEDNLMVPLLNYGIKWYRIFKVNYYVYKYFCYNSVKR